MIRSIVFDMDGVLIDSESLIMNAWKEFAKEKGIADIEHTLTQCIGITAPETEALFIRTYGQDFPFQEYKNTVSHIYQEQIAQNGLPVKPGVYGLFDFLKENGFRIGLASSTREAVVRREMQDVGLLPFFHVIVCGDMVSHSKPHPEIYLKSCRLLGTAPSLCYAVEDSPNGIRSAYQAGMKPVMVPDLLAPDDEIKEMLFREFKDLWEVRDFLMSECKCTCICP